MDLRLLVFAIYIIVYSASAVDGSRSIDSPIAKADVELSEQDRIDNVMEDLVVKLEKMAGITEQSSNEEEPTNKYNFGRTNHGAGSSSNVYRSRNHPQRNLYENPSNIDELSEEEKFENELERFTEKLEKMAGITEQSSNEEEPNSEYNFGRTDYDAGSSHNVHRPRNYPQAKSYEIPEDTDERQPSNGYNFGRSNYDLGSSRSGFGAKNYPQENLYAIPEDTDERQPSYRYNIARSNYRTGGYSNSYDQGSYYRPGNLYSAHPRINTRKSAPFVY